MRSNSGPERRDYFNGFSPSKLAQLSNEALAYHFFKLTQVIESGVGTPRELAYCAEAVQECYRERLRRRSTFHGLEGTAEETGRRIFLPHG